MTLKKKHRKLKTIFCKIQETVSTTNWCCHQGKGCILGLLSLRTPGWLRGEKGYYRKGNVEIQECNDRDGGGREQNTKLIFLLKYNKTFPYSFQSNEQLFQKSKGIYNFNLVSISSKNYFVGGERTQDCILTELFLPSHLFGRKTWSPLCN